MNSMTFLQVGPMTTIQDLGRFGFQNKGVSVCGAMDDIALRIGNRLVGNEDRAPVIEMTLMSDRIRFNRAGIIALTGVDMGFKINGCPVKCNQALYVSSGDVLSGGGAGKLIGQTSRNLDEAEVVEGARAYMAIHGHLECDKVFDSYSTDIKGGFGGLSGRKIHSGDQLSWSCESMSDQITLPRVSQITVTDQVLLDWYGHRKVRLCLSPEMHRFEKGTMDKLQENTYKITTESDRMGYRLSGDSLKHVEGCDILSSPLTKGSVQIPKDGQPIIMMSDRQTTGGYTKIGQVIRADLPYLAQRKPGDFISFEFISSEEAIDAYKKRMMSLDKAIQRAEVVLEKYSSSRDFSISVDEKRYKVNVME